MALIIEDTIKPSGNFPAVNASDVKMPDGSRLTDYEFSGSTEIPVFDLGELGMEPIPFTGGEGELLTDTTKIVEAATAGVVRFGIPFSLGSNSATAFVTCTSCIVFGMMCTCNATIVTDTIAQVIIDIYPDGMYVGLVPITVLIDEYMEEALGGDY